MFCPQCKSGYREGFVECADCSVALVYSLEEQGSNSSVNLDESVAAYVTPDMAEAQTVKKLLEDSGVSVFLSEEKEGTVSLYSDRVIRSITLLVPAAQAEQALGIVQTFQSEQLAAESGIECDACHAIGDLDAKFCDQCGKALQTKNGGI